MTSPPSTSSPSLLAGKPTLVSLAQELGVSRQTVSNVVNKPHVVHPATRARVQAAIERTGYRPSAVGRALRTRRTMNIGYHMYPLHDGIRESVMDQFLHHLTVSAQDHGYRITLLPTAEGAHRDQLANLDQLRQSSTIDAAVLVNVVHKDPRLCRPAPPGLHLVSFGRPWGIAEPLHPWVDVDGAAGTEAATRHFREQGHTRIGFIGETSDRCVSDDRREGWRRGMVGLPGDHQHWQLIAHEGARDGAFAAEELLRRGVTAFVCNTDSLALGAFHVLRSRGDLTGQEVPVIGFDNTPVAQTLGMSSVSQPLQATADQVVSLIVALAARDPAARRQRVLLKPQLEVRRLEAFAA